MTVPGWRDWAFALKTLAAAMLALFLAMWIDLPRPYWAVGTVYITSQVLAGATRSKALYRVLGTLLGAIVAVILVPNLVNSPELLTLAIAAWVAGCLYVSMLDRTSASYLTMLAGYSAALVGFPAVGDPGSIFDSAIARAEEISLGIVCAALVSSVVLPQSVAPLIAGRLETWIQGARAWAIEALGLDGSGQDRPTARIKLASDAVAFDALATPLRYDMTGAERSADAMATLRQHMLMFLPIVSAVSDRIDALKCDHALTARIKHVIGDLAAWLASSTTDPEAAARHRAASDALDPDLGKRPDWDTLLLASLVARLRDLIDLRQDVRLLRHHVVEGVPVHEQIAFRYTARARTVRHRDHGMALLSAIGAFASIVVCSVIWIATGWPDGAGAPMMAAVTCCLFGTQDDPAPFILSFAHSAVIGVVVAGVWLFAILPSATSFEMVALALSPPLIVVGLLMAQPATAAIGLGTVVNGFTLMALQESYTGDFAPFVNSAIAVVVGMWIGAVVTRLVRSVGAEWAARRLHRINRASLAEAAAGKGARHGLDLAALMLDRIGLIASRLASLPPEDANWTADLLAEVRVGINVVELRRNRRGLPRPARSAVATLLNGVAEHFRGRASAAPDLLLGQIDDALDAVIASPSGATRGSALMGLVGVRRSLFPDATAYRPSHPAGSETRLAA